MDIDYATALLFEEEFQHQFGSSWEYNNTNSITTKQLQDKLKLEVATNQSGVSGSSATTYSTDFMLAKNLQEQFDREDVIENPSGDLTYDRKKQNIDVTKSIVDPSWEVIDPTPDVHRLFIAFNRKFFWGTLDSVCVSWSKKMKRCAGVCSYSPNAGFCRITLSEPLLKLRPRKDLVETLLHEMIHAYLFVAHNDREREGHGPEFHRHMNRINNEVGTNITVYHDFHDEVELYLQHKWRCNGPCQNWVPYFGFIKRSINRAPGPNDRWWAEHSRSCGGSFTKVQSPEPKSKIENGVNVKKSGKENKAVGNILKYFPNTKLTPAAETSFLKNYSNIHTISTPSSGLAISVAVPSKTNNIHGFSNDITGGRRKLAGQAGSALNSNTVVFSKNTATLPIKSTRNTGTVVANSASDKKNGHLCNEISLEIDVVRNHWVNKFPNNATRGDSVNSSPICISNKRKSDNEPSISKISKLEDKTYPQGSSGAERVPCPVCNVSYLMGELNGHLDNCLSNPGNIQKECIVCLKNYKESEYENHFNKCLKRNLNVKEESLDFEKINCKICNNDITKNTWSSHLRVCRNRNKCPECYEIIEPGDYDVHLAKCLMKKLDTMNERYSDKKEEDMKSDSTIREERIDCLACGKNIFKSQLNSHLDECLNEVFQDDEMTKRDITNDDDKMYNCPICLKLVSVVDMNEHINICLKIVDEDNEIEINKRQFLNEMD